MKNYRIKNYKGNLVESLTKFAESHKGMRIMEAVEDGEELKVKAEVEKGCGKLQEATGNKVYVVMYDDDSLKGEDRFPRGIATSLEKARELAKAWHNDYEHDPENPIEDLMIFEMPLDSLFGMPDYLSFKREKA